MSRNKNARPRKSKKGPGSTPDAIPEVVSPGNLTAEPEAAPPSVDTEVVTRVGFAAGKIWGALQDGPLSLSELQTRIEEPETILLMGIGWLAREDKLAIINRAHEFELSLKVQLVHHA